jgi:hypothetical protein
MTYWEALKSEVLFQVKANTNFRNEQQKALTKPSQKPSKNQSFEESNSP